MCVCVNFNKLLPKFMWKCYKTKIAKTILKNKNKFKEQIISDFKTCYKTTLFEMYNAGIVIDI